ncbi:hypothetical protein HNQ07_004205 [Deinococcus metalli]|uniref:DUF1345 domain-containing protein n=1 Tax=Deinococcus metalli TaxID=1141878 RepID=A0A7W8KK56_9DEIO|nr:hypothetical protein [Deinococcus metalli]MBB5378698.1 hypothetical protein [Deinococcus metalli]GHF61779.1 hypothetical protein GCM10017781_42450 [Deinococcus metalli]
MTAPPPPESLWPARLAILAVIGLNLVLSEHLTLGPTWLLPSLEVLLLLPLVVVRGRARRHLIRMGPQALTWARDSRHLAIAVIALLHLTNLSSLALLVLSLLRGSSASGVSLLAGALNIWVTNVLVFSLWYWELDQAGPLRRALAGTPPDFRYPQMGLTPTMPPWRPMYLDYLFLAFTNGSAFSPTDALPLSRRAKGLMMLQAATSMLTVVLVASRAVNILK